MFLGAPPERLYSLCCLQTLSENPKSELPKDYGYDYLAYFSGKPLNKIKMGCESRAD